MFLLLEIACILGTYSDPPNSSQRPIIILPGIGKSRLSAKVDESVGCFRLKGNKFFNIWMNYAFFLPFKVECFSKVLTLQPNYSLNKLDPPHGVEIQVPGFGETYPIEIIDPIFRVGKGMKRRDFTLKTPHELFSTHFSGLHEVTGRSAGRCGLQTRVFGSRSSLRL